MTVNPRRVLPFLLALVGLMQFVGPTPAQGAGREGAFVRVKGTEIVGPSC